MTGGCQYGVIRYEITPFPLLLYTCNCTDCQRQSRQCVRVEHAGEVRGFSYSAGLLYPPSVPNQFFRSRK